MERIQKSTLWLWTTLWLTAFLDSLLLYIVFFLVVSLLHVQLPSIAILFVFLLAYAAGAYLAARYVVKHSIVLKSRANQLALWTIALPLVVTTLLLGVGVQGTLARGETLDFAFLGERVVLAAAAFGLVYFVVRSYIVTKGD